MWHGGPNASWIRSEYCRRCAGGGGDAGAVFPRCPSSAGGRWRCDFLRTLPGRCLERQRIRSLQGGGDQNNPRATRSGVSAKIAERLRAEMQSGDEKPVVLNGRGYNYTISRDPQRELRIVESEAKSQQEQAPAGR